MHWSWWDLRALPVDVYAELVRWLDAEAHGGEESVDLDAILP